MRERIRSKLEKIPPAEEPAKEKVLKEKLAHKKARAAARKRKEEGLEPVKLWNAEKDFRGKK